MPSDPLGQYLLTGSGRANGLIFFLCLGTLYLAKEGAMFGPPYGTLMEARAGRKSLLQGLERALHLWRPVRKARVTGMKYLNAHCMCSSSADQGHEPGSVKPLKTYPNRVGSQWAGYTGSVQRPISHGNLIKELRMASFFYTTVL